MRARLAKKIVKASPLYKWYCKLFDKKPCKNKYWLQKWETLLKVFHQKGKADNRLLVASHKADLYCRQIFDKIQSKNGLRKGGFNMKKILSILISMAFCFSVSAKSRGDTMALDSRSKSIVEISAYIAVSNLDGLKKAMEEGLEAGLSVNEIGELCVQSYAYVGFPRSLLAEGVLTSIVKEADEKGKDLEWGEKAKEVPSDLEKYEYGREKINSLFGRNAKQSRPVSTDYNSSTDIFLKEHLFTDIFYRGVLSDKERELSTATMLASLGNVNPMFTSHTQGAFKNGNSKEELEEMALIVGKLIGKKEGRNAENIVKQVTGAK